MRSSKQRRYALGCLLLSAIVCGAAASHSLDARWRSAIMNDDTALLRTLLARTDSPRQQISVLSGNGKSALMIACKTGDIAFVRELLALGADAQGRTATGGTPFMFATLGGHSAVIELLYGIGVETDARGENGWSAAMIAAAKGYAPVMRQLLGMGVDINVRDVYGWTPLMRAVDNGHVTVVALLLAQPGLEINHQDEAGHSALHHAVYRQDVRMVSMLLAAGIDRTLKNSNGVSAAQLLSALSSSPELSALFTAD